MKKFIIPLLLLILVAGLCACSNEDTEPPYSEPPADAVILSAKIMDIQDASLLLANVADDAGSADIYTLNAADIPVIEANQLADASSLQPGMLVDIAYNGMVMESYPMQLGGVSGIYVKDQGDDIAGLYQTVINDLYDADPGLNDGLEVLAFDLSQVVNLAAAEKSALVYLIGNDYGLPTLQGTFDELAGQGYIDKDNLYFPTGILFTIIDTPREGGNTFTFDAKKWRSGTGAYFFNDCTAKKVNDAWTYTVGSLAIS